MGDNFNRMMRNDAQFFENLLSDNVIQVRINGKDQEDLSALTQSAREGIELTVEGEEALSMYEKGLIQDLREGGRYALFVFAAVLGSPYVHIELGRRKECVEKLAQKKYRAYIDELQSRIWSCKRKIFWLKILCFFPWWQTSWRKNLLENYVKGVERLQELLRKYMEKPSDWKVVWMKGCGYFKKF